MTDNNKSCCERYQSFSLIAISITTISTAYTAVYITEQPQLWDEMYGRTCIKFIKIAGKERKETINVPARFIISKNETANTTALDSDL